jgi:hypothetical protein
MPIKKRRHYLPKAYLKAFTDKSVAFFSTGRMNLARVYAWTLKLPASNVLFAAYT